MRLFLKHATDKVYIRKSIKISLIVGTIIAAVNHYDMFIEGTYSTRRWIQIILSDLIPYGVLQHIPLLCTEDILNMK